MSPYSCLSLNKLFLSCVSHSACAAADSSRNARLIFPPLWRLEAHFAALTQLHFLSLQQQQQRELLLTCGDDKTLCLFSVGGDKPSLLLSCPLQDKPNALRACINRCCCCCCSSSSTGEETVRVFVGDTSPDIKLLDLRI